MAGTAQTHKTTRRGIVKSANQAGFLPKDLIPSVDGSPNFLRRSESEPFPKYGRQRDAPRRIVTFRHATLRVATHRYATLEPLGKPGGSRAFSADAPLNRLWLRDAYRSQPEAKTEEI